MTVIVSPNDKVIKMWGRPKASSTRYRLLSYILSCETEDGVLLQNCVTGEAVLLSEEERRIIEKLPCEYEPSMDMLIRERFLVPIEHEDKKVVLQLRRAFEVMFPQKSTVTYTILPTTGCNARCFYCYECGVEQVNMSEETASRVVEYILAHSSEEKVHIHWFGGEPLIGQKCIDQICRELSQSNAEFYSSMTSNGYLFNKDTVLCAKELWKLRKVQITVDGTEDIYNKTKAYVNADGSPYKRVMENIGLLLEQGITVEMRMNLSRFNYNDLRTLIDEVAARFKGKGRLIPYVSMLLDGVGFEPIHHNADEISRLELKKIELEDHIAELGFENSKKYFPSLKIIHCMANCDGSVTINPKGGIGKCEHYVFDEQIGDIYSSAVDERVISLWKETVEWEHCDGCPIYPSCVNLKKCQSINKCSKVLQAQKIKNYKKNLSDIYGFWKRGEVEKPPLTDAEAKR